MARTYWNVVKAAGRWEVRKQGEAAGERFGAQQVAIEHARFLATSEFIESGAPTGIRIQGSDGHWRDERTYGEEPFPPRG
jgi:hypothetical protein